MMLFGASMEAYFSSSPQPPKNKGSFSVFIMKVELQFLKTTHCLPSQCFSLPISQEERVPPQAIINLPILSPNKEDKSSLI